MERHALSVTAENHPGVLVKVCGQFSTRSANIQYLAAAPTDQRGLSHMTIVVRADQAIDVQDLVEHMEKVQHVTAVEVIEDVEGVIAELEPISERAPRTVGSLTQRAY
ncbi:acetolactate synthase-1/3 small subunit [Kytococcus aerolatus]|uniref:acetolactate synthase n=1 Tax=Kytococcus aerolatus TaxID=592308 RepID=A0A212U7R8_9MICO|nr:ACT domain-containing protein [Kytococcus aerolatus]SNC74297.1 acetolactate synthase-1/3 small subunit [Kytococcus aerolatus]